MLFSKALLSGFAVGLSIAVPNPISRYNTSQPAEVSERGDGLDDNIIRSDNYIVVMKEKLSEDDFDRHLAGVLPISIASNTREKFDIGGFKAYSGPFAGSAIKKIKANSDVAFVEKDTKIQLHKLVKQLRAPWGLGRISHKKRSSNTDYVYDSSSGKDMFAYILDTGVYAEHQEFEGRAINGANFAGDGLNTDGNGHGTHVAGTLGSRAFGVAKKINLIAVKILDSDGGGKSSMVLSGLQWAVRDIISKNRTSTSFINMSIGGTFSPALNFAVAGAVGSGIFLGVAAGNDGEPAANYSPGSSPNACTVGATDQTDTRAPYSNYGPVVDIFAPGSDILSTGIASRGAVALMSGTSMATPHIVGLAAYLTVLEGKRSPKRLCDRLRTLAEKGVVGGTLESANFLGNNGNGVK